MRRVLGAWGGLWRFVASFLLAASGVGGFAGWHLLSGMRLEVCGLGGNLDGCRLYLACNHAFVMYRPLFHLALYAYCVHIVGKAGGTEMEKTFTCDDCGKEKPTQKEGGTGYGKTKDGKVVCYDCCALRDKADMVERGNTTLYLVGHEVTNWPGTLRFPVTSLRAFRHPFSRHAVMAYFDGPDGSRWSAKNIGDTQIAHCRRLKG